MEARIKSLLNADLKEICKAYGAAVSGTKVVLQKRCIQGECWQCCSCVWERCGAGLWGSATTIEGRGLVVGRASHFTTNYQLPAACRREMVKWRRADRFAQFLKIWCPEATPKALRPSDIASSITEIRHHHNQDN